jgi:pantoate--beta-alanine ligase
MLIVTKTAELRRLIGKAREAGECIGLVPTMGYFHEGHLSLMRRAKAENDRVVVSLFVNPIQFGPQEDFAVYPRDLDRDRELAAAAGADWLFVPESGEMYPEDYQTYVEVTRVSQGLCGANRPGHFRGVATVVLKLFNIAQADRAYFGEKDAQQLRVVQRMAADLNLTVQVIGCPIVREADGLALSSRNLYLNPAERQAALVLVRTLREAGKLIEGGERDSRSLKEQLLRLIAVEPLAQLDYLEILTSRDLQPVSQLNGEILIALAVKIGRTRLIDNRVYQISSEENQDATTDV